MKYAEDVIHNNNESSYARCGRYMPKKTHNASPKKNLKSIR